MICKFNAALAKNISLKRTTTSKGGVSLKNFKSNSYNKNLINLFINQKKEK